MTERATDGLHSAHAEDLGGEVFEWLDEYFHSDSDTPDEAFDQIHMTQPADWRALNAAWSTRPPHWREACAYILGQGPVAESIPLLRRAVFDEVLEVAVEAACSFCSHCLSDPEKVDLDPELLRRLQAVADETKGKHMEDVLEVLRGARPASSIKVSCRAGEGHKLN